VLGVTPVGAVTVVAIQKHNASAVTVTYRDAAGGLGEATLIGEQLERLLLAPAESRWTFTADGADFRLAAEALRIQRAGLFDPMLIRPKVDRSPHSTSAIRALRQPLTAMKLSIAPSGETR
jgi:hypothetical protein